MSAPSDDTLKKMLQSSTTSSSKETVQSGQNLWKYVPEDEFI